MVNNVQPITLVRADYDRTVKPELMEAYSFEYAYRLFLVLCSSKKNLISSLTNEEIKDLEPFFKEGLKNCIERVGEKKGLSINEELGDRYAEFATKSLVRYIRGGMEPDPSDLAKQVTKAMEKKLYADGVLEPDIRAMRVFTERRN